MKGQDILIRPWCPFCGQNISRPAELEDRKLGEFAVGRCQCGAVYACDATGHNVGSAMVDALVFACNDDWDLAWSLLPEDDYLTGRIENYDEKTHQVVDTRNLDGRAVRGVLYFVRLHRDIAEVAQRTGKAPSSSGIKGPGKVGNFTLPEIEPERDKKRIRRKANKETVRQLTEAADIDALVDLLFDDKRTIRFLMRLLYTPDDALRWQTVDALGKSCARYATRHPGPVSDLLHRLFGAAADSAASSWGAIEAIGAIIANRPDIYGAFTRHLLQFLADPARLEATLWSLGSIAENRPDLIRALPFSNMFKLVNHPRPEIRGAALRLFGNIHAREIRPQIAELTTDESPVLIYQDGETEQLTVGRLAADALKKIDHQ
jgi:hypothetical protein